MIIMEQFKAKIRKVGNSFVITIPKFVYTPDDFDEKNPKNLYEIMEIKQNEERFFLISKDKVIKK